MTAGELYKMTRSEASSNLFRRYTMPDLLAEPDTFAWQVRGLLAQPTYGQIAGEMKVLKSLVLKFVMVGLASGLPIFGTFIPSCPQPVLAYVGEGGQAWWTRRIRRVCSALGVNPADLDLHPCFDVAPIGSLVFQESLRRDLDEIEPGLVTLDPLYTYHGTTTRASDLHQEGALLNMLSTPCVEAGASLVVVNHFNQTGGGSSLKRITMAGSGEWADSWVLLEHRGQPDVAAGMFMLNMEIGSRQWGGSKWELDLDIGRFDEETGTHDGEITWDIRRASALGSGRKRFTAKVEGVQKAILDVLADCPWERSKTQIMETVRGDRTVFKSAFDDLADTGVISNDHRGRQESGTTKRRLVWGLTPTKADADRPGSTDGAE